VFACDGNLMEENRQYICLKFIKVIKIILEIFRFIKIKNKIYFCKHKKTVNERSEKCGNRKTQPRLLLYFVMCSNFVGGFWTKI
jgi:hypothetical protein